MATGWSDKRDHRPEQDRRARPRRDQSKAAKLKRAAKAPVLAVGATGGGVEAVLRALWQHIAAKRSPQPCRSATTTALLAVFRRVSSWNRASMPHGG